MLGTKEIPSFGVSHASCFLLLKCVHARTHAHACTGPLVAMAHTWLSAGYATAVWSVTTDTCVLSLLASIHVSIRMSTHRRCTLSLLASFAFLVVCFIIFFISCGYFVFLFYFPRSTSVTMAAACTTCACSASACMLVRACLCVHACACMLVCVCMCACMCVDGRAGGRVAGVCAYMCMHACIDACVHVCMH